MENTPAKMALSFAVESDDMLNSRLGRPRMNLLPVLRRDSGNINLQFAQG